MKILWVVYTIFPDLAVSLGKQPPVGGGWMYGLAKDLAGSGVSLTVATAGKNRKEHSCTIDGITYYLLNGKKNREIFDKTLGAQWKRIIEEVKPDVVHIHGTEYAHGLALMNACPQLKYVISIQGMTSVYARYYLGGLTSAEVRKNYTLRDFVRWDSLFQQQAKFRNRGKNIEVPYIKKAENIIGRTQWDHDHVKTINPDCTYYFCNESLRDPFYSAPKWNINNKKDHSIFLSQAGYPLKGLHKVLEAVHLIKDIYPDIHLRVARNNITRSETLEDKLRMGGYGRYIKRMLKDFSLQEHVTFTGPLDEDQMVREYLNSHIYICPSSIENSPNSLGEAQLLGVPCIASYVGGIANMVDDRKTGILYRFEEVEMLAQAILRIFDDNAFAKELSANAVKAASRRHDRNANVLQLKGIYEQIR